MPGPKQLVDVDEFTSPIGVPVNGDPINGAVFEAPYQALANRTRNLRNELDNGIKRMREVANKAALLALTGVTTGDFAYVVGLGLYRFAAGAAEPGLEPMVIAGPPTQGGNWRNVMSPAVGVLGGVVGATAAGFLAPSGLHASFGIVQAQGLTSTQGIGTAGPIIKMSKAFTRERVVTGPLTDATFSPDDADVVIVPVTQDAHNYTLTATPAHLNATIRIVMTELGQGGVIVKANGGVTIATLTDVDRYATFLYAAAGWVRIA
jgi:hypothetical protein